MAAALPIALEMQNFAEYGSHTYHYTLKSR
jgi:hypothetical protein